MEIIHASSNTSSSLVRLTSKELEKLCDILYSLNESEYDDLSYSLLSNMLIARDLAKFGSIKELQLSGTSLSM